MRRAVVLAVLALTTAFASAEAQSRGRRSPRLFATVSDGLGVGSGGTVTGGTGLAQMMRAGAVARVYGTHGLDLSAVRIQMVIPANSQFEDPEYNDPSGDALILSYAGMRTPRGGGFPSVFTIGGGVVRRKTSLATDKETWAARIGFDGESMLRPTEWLDANISAHLLVMPGRDRRQMYTAALSVGFRIG